jgi:hypothetical protein
VAKHNFNIIHFQIFCIWYIHSKCGNPLVCLETAFYCNGKFFSMLSSSAAILMKICNEMLHINLVGCCTLS